MHLLLWLLLVPVAVVVYFVYKLFLRSAIWAWRMKRLHGNELHAYIYPIAGAFHWIKQSEKKHGDSFKELIDFTRANPECKAIASTVVRQELMLIDPDLIREFLVTKQNQFAKLRTLFYANHFLDEGLIMTSGAQWKNQRSILSPAFHYDMLMKRLPTIKQVTMEIVNKIEDTMLKNPTDPIACVRWCQQVAGEVFVRSFFGANFVNKTFDGKSMALAVADLVAEMGQYSIGPKKMLKTNILGIGYWDYPKFFLSAYEIELRTKIQRFMDVCEGYLQERIDAHEAKSASSDEEKNLLDWLLDAYFEQKQETRGDLPKKELVQQFVNLFFAGTDTTGNTTGMAIYLLTQHPDVYAKLLEEIETVCPGDPSTLKSEDLKKMEYTEAVIKETFRFYTPAPSVVTRVALNKLKIGEFTVEKGQCVSIWQIANMRSAKYFKEPDTFRPSRWFEAETREIPSYVFLPFSGGPRNCIGQHLALMESKVILTYFMKRWQIVSNPEVECRMELKLLYNPKDDRLVYFKPRVSAG